VSAHGPLRSLAPVRRGSVRSARMAAASASLLALAGCATWSADGGFSTVQFAATQELGKEAARIRTPEDAVVVDARVKALLAKPLDADRAVQIALLNNRGLQAAYSDLGLAEVTMVEAGLPPSPTLAVARLASPGGLVTEVERQIVVNILSLATLPQRKAIARERFRQAELAAALATLQVAADARRDFYRAAAAHQSVHLLERAQLSAAAASEVVQQLGQTGAVPKIDQAREQAFYAEITAQLAQAKLRHTQATEALIRTLGLWGADLEHMKETGALPPLPRGLATQADVETEALRRRLDLQIARLELYALGQTLGLEQATRYVDLVELIGLSASEREVVIEHGEKETEQVDLRGAELEFQVPIFDFGEARVRRARETYLQAVHRLAALGVNVRSEARQAFKTQRATYDIARLYQNEVVPLRKIVTDEATLRYSSMNAEIGDLLLDVRTAIQSNIAATEALRDYWIATVDLQMALAAGGAGAGVAEAAAAAAPAGGGGAPH
jgi:outer membrane protein TolC